MPVAVAEAARVDELGATLAVHVVVPLVVVALARPGHLPQVAHARAPGAGALLCAEKKRRTYLAQFCHSQTGKRGEINLNPVIM